MSTVGSGTTLSITILVGRCRGQIGRFVVDACLTHLFGKLSDLAIDFLQVGDNILVVGLSLFHDFTVLVTWFVPALHALGGELLLLIVSQGGILFLGIIPILNVVKLALPGLEFRDVDGVCGRPVFRGLLNNLLDTKK